MMLNLIAIKRNTCITHLTGGISLTDFAIRNRTACTYAKGRIKSISGCAI